jgi:hypothetical protein
LPDSRDLEPRALAADRTDDAGEQLHGHALERADVEAADLAGVVARDVVGERAQVADHVVGVTQQELAERRQLDGSRTARPVEDGPTDGALERRDLLTHRRLGVPEPVGSACERALARHRSERDEVTDFEIAHHGREISAADGQHKGSSLLLELGISYGRS